MSVEAGHGSEAQPPGLTEQVPLKVGCASDCDAGAESFLQTGFWGEFKSGFGWKPRHFLAGEDLRPILVLERGLFCGVSFAYVPRGPAWRECGDTGRLAGIAAALRSHFSTSCAFLRFDPPWYIECPGEPLVDPPALGLPFRRASADVQPPDTTVLDLGGRSDEDLLAGMKPKWRYNIRYAEKKGVTVTFGRGAAE
ncbi:MAG TPA: peptidoglycan bridge formation glycyltransferase FemA/FemB family protein, partial [Magnetospirillaceae bacterium]|nr:peptidoglycan bridge formation glycyltransferase FemA/FemB family protein [Magnetospirillaceae bacterium]